MGSSWKAGRYRSPLALAAPAALASALLFEITSLGPWLLSSPLPGTPVPCCGCGVVTLRFGPLQCPPWGGIPDYPIQNGTVSIPSLWHCYKRICLLIYYLYIKVGVFCSCYMFKVFSRAWHMVGDAPKYCWMNKWMGSSFSTEFFKRKMLVSLHIYSSRASGAAMKHLDHRSGYRKHGAQSLLVPHRRWVSKGPEIMSSIRKSGVRKVTDPSETKQWEEMTTRVDMQMRALRLWVLTYFWSRF